MFLWAKVSQFLGNQKPGERSFQGQFKCIGVTEPCLVAPSVSRGVAAGVPALHFSLPQNNKYKEFIG